MVRILIAKVSLFIVLVLGINAIVAYATTETPSALDSGFLTYQNPDYHIKMDQEPVMI